MNRTQLLKKLETMLDEYERSRAWGTIEIELREGKPNYLRKMTTEKLYEETSHARRFER